MRRNFKELRDEALANNPDRAARVERFRRAMEDAVKLAELRESRAASQQEVAGRLGVSQGRVSQIEHADDLYLRTLSGYVEALGGHLRIAAEFPDDVINIHVPPVA